MGKSKRLLGKWVHNVDMTHEVIVESVRNGYVYGKAIWDLPPIPDEGKFRETVEYLQENYWKDEE